MPLAKRNYHCVDDAEADVADPVHMYYVNDGVYGSFNCILYDHVTVEASLLDVSLVSPPINCCICYICGCLKCFDAVGWVAERASSL